MRSLEVQIDHAGLEQKLEVLRGIKKGAPKAMMRAMNRTLAGMKTDAAKEASARYIIKQKDVKSKLRLRKASMSDLSVIMSSTGRPTRLVYFKTKPNKDPGVAGRPTVFARVKRGNPGARIRGAFMANFRAGDGSHSGIFVRTGKWSVNSRGSTRGQKREKIRQLYGPGVVQKLNHPEVSNIIQTKATARFNRELDHQINHLLNHGKEAAT